MLTKSKTYILILTKKYKAHQGIFFLHTLLLEKGSSN